MGSITGGFKAGVIAAGGKGIIEALATYGALIVNQNKIIESIERTIPFGVDTTPKETFHTMLLFLPLGAILFAELVGMALGGLFGLFNERVPGRTGMRKGVILSSIAFAISLVLGVGNYGVADVIFTSELIVSDLFAAMVFGLMTGTLYVRFTPPESA